MSRPDSCLCLVLSHRCYFAKVRDRLLKGLYADRFGKKVVHASIQTTIAVSSGRVGGQCNYGRCLISPSYDTGCLEAVHLRHENIHETDWKGKVRNNFVRATNTN